MLTLLQLNLQHIWTDRLCVSVGNTHPLAKKKQLSLSDLAQHKAILPARGTFTREIIEDAFADKKLELNISLASNYLETIKMLVSVGLGWSILPEQMKSRDLKFINVTGLSLERKLGVVTHAKRSLSNAAIELFNLLA